MPVPSKKEEISGKKIENKTIASPVEIKYADEQILAPKTLQRQVILRVDTSGPKTKKAFCRNRRPLTIACHMKKNSK